MLKERMKPFLVCADYKSGDSYSQMREEFKEKLGVEDLHGQPPWEAVKYQSHYYIRSLYFDEPALYYTALSEWTPKIDSPKDGIVLCLCGNKAFYIQSVYSAPSGICTECKRIHGFD